MKSIPNKRKEAIYFKFISQVLSEEITNANISSMTVIGVELSRDGAHLKVFLTFKGNIQNSLKNLNQLKVKGFIRRRLSSIIKQRKTPMIYFEHDQTFERAQKIENILKNIKSNK